MTSINDFEDQYETLKQFETRKNDFVESLFACVKSLKQALTESGILVKHQTDLVYLYDRQKEEAERELRELKQAIAELGFIVVLVDGDAMPFLDDLVRQYERGGQEAARLLRLAVLEHARQQHPDLAPGTKVVIRVYANMKGLATTYQRLSIIQHADHYVHFQRGFSMEHPLTDFVDAGYGKDRADEKLKESFKLFVSDVHCKHIIFCASTDNGYARLLEQYASTPEICDRISLVEGPPFESEIAQLKARFKVFSIGTVFCSSKLQVASKIPSPGGSPANRSPIASPASALIQPLNYATTAVKGSANGAQKTLNMRSPETKDSAPSTILRNRNGARIDPPRPTRISDTEMMHIKKQKYCNLFHLKGSCIYTRCTHEHGEKLNAGQIEVLRYVARMTPCSSGLGCTSVTCILGHACPRLPCVMKDCRFPKAMHDVDSNVVSRISI